jgi:hypothetical protein
MSMPAQIDCKIELASESPFNAVVSGILTIKGHFKLLQAWTNPWKIAKVKGLSSPWICSLTETDLVLVWDENESGAQETRLNFLSAVDANTVFMLQIARWDYFYHVRGEDRSFPFCHALLISPVEGQEGVFRRVGTGQFPARDGLADDSWETKTVKIV